MILPRPKNTAMFFNVVDILFLVDSGLSLSEPVAIAAIDIINSNPITAIVTYHNPLWLNDSFTDTKTNSKGMELVITFFGDE